MRPENKRMQEYLKANGIEAIPKYIATGSLKHSWRLYGTGGDGWEGYQKWTPELVEKLTALGFRGLHNPLGKFDGNGGLFSVCVRGHYEFLNGPETAKNLNPIHQHYIMAGLRVKEGGRT